MNKTKKIMKWGLILVLSYFIFTTLYFGYDDIDSNKGVYKFNWSGIDALWKKDEDFGFKKNETVSTKFNGSDGPYVYGDTVFFVDQKNKFESYQLNGIRKVTIQTSLAQLPTFDVVLKDTILHEPYHYKMPNKLIAISDIEGNFAGFFSFLLANKIIDKYANWIYGNGHLLLNGDFVDRGNQVTQVLWLIYHLEMQAEKKGGKVHFILGNHEIMNLYGDVSYNDFKYIEVAKRISKQTDWDLALRKLYGADSELGNWLRSKNIIEKIGSHIFVHGGLNMHHLNGKYDITEINSIAESYYGIYPSEKNVRKKRDRVIINSIDSPFWDRRLNFEWMYKVGFLLHGVFTKATTPIELDSILKFYKAERIIIGHSVVSDISTGYDNKVIMIDLKHGQKVNSGKTKGLLIENNTYFKVDDIKTKAKLFN